MPRDGRLHRRTDSSDQCFIGARYSVALLSCSRWFYYMCDQAACQGLRRLGRSVIDLWVLGVAAVRTVRGWLSRQQEAWSLYGFRSARRRTTTQFPRQTFQQPPRSLLPTLTLHEPAPLETTTASCSTVLPAMSPAADHGDRYPHRGVRCGGRGDAPGGTSFGYPLASITCRCCRTAYTWSGPKLVLQSVGVHL